VAIQKAKTAIAFKRATKTFEERTLAGRTVLLALPGVVPIEGGIPIIVDGQFIGALGVSGGSSEQDGLAAKAAMDAFSAR
jgi:glc operon protein GlcG